MPFVRDFSKIGDFCTFPMAILDARAHTVYLNTAFEELIGYEAGHLIGKNPWTVLKGENTSKKTLDFMKSQMASLLPFDTSLVQYGQNGLPFWTGIYVVPFRDETTGEQFYVSLQRELKKVGEPVMSNTGFSSQVGDLLSLAGK